MQRKFITACMAIAAFAAFVLPATASASPELGETVGGVFNKLATGKLIQGTNVGNTVMTIESEGKTDGRTVECNTASLTGELTENSGTSFKGNITSASFTNGAEPDCSSSLGPIKVNVFSLPWCLASAPKDGFTVRGGKCSDASRPLTFEMVITNLFNLTCEYEKASASGTFVTHPSAAILSIVNQTFVKEVPSSSLCPEAGELDMSFTLETDGTKEDLYIR